MPTVEENVTESSWNYPLLYGDDQFTRWRVLNQLFFVCGNGYEWQGGEITPVYEDMPRRVTQEQHNAGLRGFYQSIKLRKYFNESGLGPVKPIRTVPFYPLNEYSMVVSMPDNVTDDYLLWGMRFLNFAVDAPTEWFADMPAKREGSFGYIPEREKVRVTEHREYFKYRFAGRLEALNV